MVDGFIHEFEKECKELTIPKDINAMCMEYFYQPSDKFSMTIADANYFDISDDCLSATKCGKGKTIYPSIFGEQLIESMDNNSIYSWTFEILHISVYFAIGISSKFVADYGIFKDTYIYNGYSGSLRRDGGQRIWDYGPRWKDGDKIQMIFDVGEGHLSFIVNDQPIVNTSDHNKSGIEGVAFGDVKKSKEVKYRMGFSTNTNGDGCRLIDFTQTHP